MKNHLAGELAEMAFAYQAVARGWQVYLPMSHHSKVDVAIGKPGTDLIGVQVKKASRQKKPCGNLSDSWKVLVGSARSGKAGMPRRRKRLKQYKHGDFNVLAIYVEEFDTFAFYALEDVAGRASMRWSTGKGIADNWEIFENE